MRAFAGIDLAWGSRRGSGVAVLSLLGDRLREAVPTRVVHTDADICDYLRAFREAEVLVIAVDAPLVVPNATGERPVEKQMRQRFARQHAACYPANRRLLGDPPRGERLCSLLHEQLGVSIVTAPPVGQACRVVFEVYPHAALVRLFALPRILEYKAKKGRSPVYRRQQMREYIALIASLSAPRLHMPDWLAEPPTALLPFEDKVDAFFCAWLSARAWLVGGEVLGDLATGSIWLP
ncbi:MAG: hypothetical protein C4335_01505 [Armatimonadota bacterium]